MKKTNLFISLACALVLVAVMAAPSMVAAADEWPIGATVTVNEYISSTISGAVDFGSLNPGEADVPALGQGVTGAITLTVNAETNVDCDITIAGSDDFSDGGANNFPLGNATWNDSNTPPGTAMNTVAALVGQFTTPGAAADFNVWHWITIDNGQPAAAYGTDFLYTVDKT